MVPFLTLENIHVSYFEKEALNGISLELNEGEHWALTGPSGSGKTTLLESIAGQHLIRKGSIHHHYYRRFLEAQPVADPHFNYKHLLASVTLQHHFRNRYNLGEFYYQQRFNSADADEAVPVRDYLQAVGAEAAAFRPDAGETGTHRIEQVIRELHLEELLDKSLIKLSNGETRRLQFAAALLKRPLLLLLDAPFTGLDEATRPYFHRLINRLMASGLTVVMATSEDEIPEGITHVARLENGRLAGTWTRAEFQAKQPSAAGPVPIARPGLQKLIANWPSAEFEYAVRMRNVSIRYESVQVLSQVDWEVKRGARWALSGHNGAGKSTLLSLITADNPQGYANDLVLFDRKRGSGESIWDIKKKIGFMSPEMHQYFKTSDSCLEIVLSGFFDTHGLIKKCSPEQLHTAERWMEVLDIAGFATQRFRHTPLSTQRLVLLARALVKQPPLLILDEPCQGMDSFQVSRIRQLIDRVCSHTDLTLIYVSHYRHEIPSCVSKLLKLEGGRVVYRGALPATS